MNELTIYRGTAPATAIASVNIDTKTVFTQKVMEVEVIEAHFIVPAAIPIQLGDYVTLNNKTYTLEHLPTISKTNVFTNKYKVFFHGILYQLNYKLFISSDGLSEFSEVGTVSQFLTLIVEQINQIQSGWQVGTVEESGALLLDFVNETCLEALNKVANTFKFEFELDGKTINFKKVIGTPRDITFEYGRNKGLYNIERKQVDSKAVFTRVFGFGGTKNIPFDYRDRAKKLVFEERKLEQNTAIYGIREANFTDETIYPQRTAAITDANVFFTNDAFDENSYVADSTLDFNINDFLLEGQSAKIVFKSGDLNGVEFEIWKYSVLDKRIYFKAFQDTDGYTLPKTGKMPRIGDLYTLVDLKMPPSYVIQAELELKKATQAYLDANSVPKTLYEVKIDPKYTKANEIVVNASDLVKIKDVTLGVDRAIRIQELKYPLVNQNKITALIADYIPYELQDYVNRTSTKTVKQFQALNNRISKLSATQKTVFLNQSVQNITNTVTGSSGNTIVVNNQTFYLHKSFDNTQADALQTGDIISGNFWDRNTYVQAWQFLGNNKNIRSNWLEANSIDFTPLEEDVDAFPDEPTPLEFVLINDRQFKLIKGWQNTDVTQLEVGDFIYDNLFTEFDYWDKAQYLGGNVNIKSSWKVLGQTNLEP
jgi:hypothetical protein